MFPENGTPATSAGETNLILQQPGASGLQPAPISTATNTTTTTVPTTATATAPTVSTNAPVIAYQPPPQPSTQPIPPELANNGMRSSIAHIIIPQQPQTMEELRKIASIAEMTVNQTKSQDETNLNDNVEKFVASAEARLMDNLAERFSSTISAINSSMDEKLTSYNPNTNRLVENHQYEQQQYQPQQQAYYQHQYQPQLQNNYQPRQKFQQFQPRQQFQQFQPRQQFQPQQQNRPRYQ
ncbi:ras-interacting protein RIP3-like [Mytilus californianus]|uniref:ras-interacting protein RIP3-like n=1 Tax=Mytilus californianus TaxID=6549 RepID=UPI002246BA15|nr:ras-interacting protein RIP3-like [Mytilus californianus]